MLSGKFVPFIHLQDSLANLQKRAWGKTEDCKIFVFLCLLGTIEGKNQNEVLAYDKLVQLKKNQNSSQLFGRTFFRKFR